jgi:hypothetical protein
MYKEGHEIALHLHPQWFNARHEQGRWLLDGSEYNLCTLPPARITQVIDQSLKYLRHTLGEPRFTPLSFRAGNWLFQPTQTAASVLSTHGIKIDSSVFKGGLQHNYRLDYRAALKNGYYWPFSCDANEPDPAGTWLEVPIYTEMVPSWRMATSKRLGLSNSMGMAGHSAKRKVNRIRDLMRLRYPLKLDFCRMTLDELTSMMKGIMREEQADPGSYRPIVSIGHSKDLTDPATVDRFLAFLRANVITVSTFEDIYPKLISQEPHPSSGEAYESRNKASGT